MKPDILIIIESSPLETTTFEHLLKIIPFLTEKIKEEKIEKVEKIEIFFHKNADLHLALLNWQDLKGVVLSACPTKNQNLPDFITQKTIPQLGECINAGCKVMVF